MTNDPTTKSPTLTFFTSRPTSSTTPAYSWPITWWSAGSIPRYGHRSDPQMQVAVRRTTASVGSIIFGSSRSSTRTSPAVYITTPRIRLLLSNRSFCPRCLPHEPERPEASASFQIRFEERLQLVEGDQLHPVVEIDVAGPRDDEQFLRFGGPLVGVFAELPGMCLVARDEEHGAGRDRLDVLERVEVQELDVARQGRVRRQFRRCTFGGVFTSRGAVEVVELALDGGRVFVQLVHGPA